MRVGALTAVVPESRNGSCTVVGPWCEERVRWSTGGRSLIDGPRPGDRVALHWDWLCDVVTDEQATRIETLEARQRAELGPIRRPFGSESRS